MNVLLYIFLWYPCDTWKLNKVINIDRKCYRFCNWEVVPRVWHVGLNLFLYSPTKSSTSPLTSRGRCVVTWQSQGACSREVKRGRQTSKLSEWTLFHKNANHHKLTGKDKQSCYFVDKCPKTDVVVFIGACMFSYRIVLLWLMSCACYVSYIVSSHCERATSDITLTNVVIFLSY